jgi:uncharacterized protein YuzE
VWVGAPVVADSVEVEPGVCVRVSDDGRIIGVEVVDAGARLKAVQEAERQKLLPRTRLFTDEEIEGLREYVNWFGAAHVEDCPEDDTCDCACKPLNDAVNSVFRKLFDAAITSREQAAQQTNEATIQRLLADPVRQECDSLKEQRDTWHANYLAAEQLRQSAEAVAFQDRKRAETAEQALEAAEQKIKSLTARAIVAEQHKTLELLSKGSATEQLEMRLREKLAAAELRAEAAEQRITALEGALRAKVQEWRTQIHHETPPLNAIQAGSWDTKRQCADELDALLTPSAGSPDSKRSTE